MRNTAIAKVFSDIADLLELKGENQFKIRAYQKAVRAIEHYPKEIRIMIDEGEDLKNIPGVGDAIAKKTTELVKTGKLEYYEKIKAEFPKGITNLLDIPGIGPKTANKLCSELGITSADALEQAIKDGSVATLFRLGEKTANNILQPRSFTQPIVQKQSALAIQLDLTAQGKTHPLERDRFIRGRCLWCD